MQRKIFTSEHEDFRASVRNFIEREITPHIFEWEVAGMLPREIWKKCWGKIYHSTLALYSQKLKYPIIMAKSKDQKKEVKKEATKSMKEKRAEKRDKKPKYD